MVYPVIEDIIICKGFTMDVRWEPGFDRLRTDPRFHEILERIGLP